jgi:hypothetical protein
MKSVAAPHGWHFQLFIHTTATLGKDFLDEISLLPGRFEVTLPDTYGV